MVTVQPIDLINKDYRTHQLVYRYTKLIPASHMEPGCPGTWALELPTPNPGSKSTPKACLPAT